MRELRKVFWICYAIQAVLVLLLAFIIVLLAQGTMAFPASLWIIQVTHFANHVACSILTTVKFSRMLKRIDPDEHEKIFTLYYMQYGFKALNHVFGNNKNAATKKLLKAFMVSYSLLVAVIFVESAAAFIILSFATM